MEKELRDTASPHMPIFSIGKLSFGYYGIVLHISWLFLLFYTPGIGTSLFPQAEYISPSYIASTASLVSMLIIIAAIPKQCVDYFNKTLWCWIVPLLMAAGTILCILYYNGAGFWLGVAGGVITGLSSSIMAVRWVHEYSKLDLDDLFINLPMIAAASIILCFSLLFFPLPVLIVILVCAPLASGWSLTYVQRIAHTDLVYEDPVMSHNIFAYAAVALSIGVVGFSSGFLDFAAQESGGNSYSSVFYLLIAATLFVSAGVYIRAHRRSLFASAFILPTCMVVVVLIPYLHAFMSNPSIVFIALGEICYEALLMLLSAAYAFYFGVSAVRIFCLGRIFMALLDLVGWFFAMNLHQTVLSESGPQFMLLCAFLGIEMICVIVFAALLLGRKHQNAENELEELSAKAPEKDYGETIRRNCVQMQDEFYLSARELDVLVLLARGYSATAIQEHLHIAAGTVNSHTRNIYRKLDVHSKSEIIDMVDQWEKNHSSDTPA